VPERPKKATSDPEINAEHKSNRKSVANLSAKALSKTIKFNTVQKGSGSKSYNLSFKLKW
jgi:DNA-directed RNA polymerase